ncbi:hypothetical protein [Acidihalobacter ferrooxydans]|uniref:Polysaccharide biosynthesis protein C-terminal domain-containing protein n=1 Tax=Acidihalobacter ferrooxydans TaxID=1765967 RepID=A0A1P8UI93_9GAMM|nr:hypothetical protein [Acidihalobacter ferrooxydans]APZ43481.1 hypothetical protein BW247_10590 [Acidihalobacter ferrooxydans]
MSRQAFAVHGWMKAMLKMSVVFGLSSIASIVVFIHLFGFPGIAVGLVLNGILGGMIYFIVAMRRLDISWKRLGAGLWRSFVGTVVMAGLLNLLGFGWFDSHPGFSNLGLALQLTEMVAIGAISYVSSILVLWWISGRPDGPERDLLDYLRRVMIARKGGHA